MRVGHTVSNFFKNNYDIHLFFQPVFNNGTIYYSPRRGRDPIPQIHLDALIFVCQNVPITTASEDEAFIHLRLTLGLDPAVILVFISLRGTERTLKWFIQFFEKTNDFIISSDDSLLYFRSEGNCSSLNDISVAALDLWHYFIFWWPLYSWKKYKVGKIKSVTVTVLLRLQYAIISKIFWIGLFFDLSQAFDR